MALHTAKNHSVTAVEEGVQTLESQFNQPKVLSEGEWAKVYKLQLEKHDITAKTIQTRLSVVQHMLETDE